MRPKINYFVAFQNFRKFFRSSGCFCITHCDATLSSRVILTPLSTKDLSGGAAVEELLSSQLIEMSLLVAEIFVLKLIFSLILLRICCCFFFLLLPPLGEKEWLLTPTQYIEIEVFLVPRTPRVLAVIRRSERNADEIAKWKCLTLLRHSAGQALHIDGRRCFCCPLLVVVGGGGWKGCCRVTKLNKFASWL